MNKVGIGLKGRLSYFLLNRCYEKKWEPSREPLFS